MGEIILPTDNELGVPCLTVEPPLPHAPQVAGPVLAWGSVRRTANASTWAFYVDDYRFEALWRDPLAPLRAGARELVEVNYTVHDDTPRAGAIWATYRKRYLARLWQDAGASVWVDLCSSHVHADLTLLGVPSGWQRYATAGWDCRIADLDVELEMAVRHSAGAPFTLLVWGGGSATRAWCQSRSNVVHVGRSADSRVRPGEGTRRAATQRGPMPDSAVPARANLPSGRVQKVVT
jgi:hypothetical protein